MTLKKTIKAMLTDYPTLFQDRAQCLNQLFCVGGNGLEWHKGQLVDKYSEPNKHERKTLKDNKAEEALQQSLDWGVDMAEVKNHFQVELTNYIQYRLYDFYRIERAKKHIDDIAKPNFHNFINTGFKFYSLYQFAKIVTIPDNIKTDWLDGARETLLLLNKYGMDQDNEESKKLLKKLNKDKRFRNK